LLHLDVLKKLMVFRGLHGNYERALAYGQQILRQDATREGVHRYLMWLYWQAGDRGAALAQYKRCAQILQEELGVAPMTQTMQLYQAIMRRPAEVMPTGPKLWSDQSPASPSTTRPAVATEARQALQHLEEILATADSELHHLRSLLGALREEAGYSRDQGFQPSDIW
jgi:tetratricopeptide (TPR) repeat protein